MSAYPNMFDSTEVERNVKNLLLQKVQKKVRVLQSIMAVHLGHGWWYLQLELACSTVIIEGKKPYQQWQRASWAPLKVFACHLPIVASHSKLSKVITSLCWNQPHIIPEVCGVYLMYLHLWKKEKSRTSNQSAAAIREVPNTVNTT